MDVVLGTFLLLFSLDGFCTFACGALAGILHLYAWNTLLSFRPFASWTRERRVIGCMDRFTLPDAMAFLDESFARDILSFGSDFMLDML